VAEPDDPNITHIEAEIADLDAQIAALLERRARKVRAVAALKGLHDSKQYVNVQATMLQTHRVHHSRGRSDDSLTLYANEAHHSIRSLANAAGCSAPLLTQARDGKCSISRALALKVQALTRSKTYPKGFEASKANWPKIRQD
jgi:chorismate mutase